jgi:hypothetical protein
LVIKYVWSSMSGVPCHTGRYARSVVRTSAIAKMQLRHECSLSSPAESTDDPEFATLLSDAVLLKAEPFLKYEMSLKDQPDH